MSRAWAGDQRTTRARFADQHSASLDARIAARDRHAWQLLDGLVVPQESARTLPQRSFRLGCQLTFSASYRRSLDLKRGQVRRLGTGDQTPLLTIHQQVHSFKRDLAEQRLAAGGPTTQSPVTERLSIQMVTGPASATASPSPTPSATATPTRTATRSHTPTRTMIDTPTVTPMCRTYAASDVPRFIPDLTAVDSNQYVSDSDIITDVNVLDVRGTHGTVGDLTFELFGPDSTKVSLVTRRCGLQDDFHFSVDYEAADAVSCPLGAGSTYKPEGRLINQ